MDKTTTPPTPSPVLRAAAYLRAMADPDPDVEPCHVLGAHDYVTEMDAVDRLASELEALHPAEGAVALEQAGDVRPDGCRQYTPADAANFCGPRGWWACTPPGKMLARGPETGPLAHHLADMALFKAGHLAAERVRPDPRKAAIVTDDLDIPQVRALIARARMNPSQWDDGAYAMASLHAVAEVLCGEVERLRASHPPAGAEQMRTVIEGLAASADNSGLFDWGHVRKALGFDGFVPWTQTAAALRALLTDTLTPAPTIDPTDRTYATLLPDGRVGLPAKMIERHGLKVGDVVYFVDRGPQLPLEVMSGEAMGAYLGCEDETPGPLDDLARRALQNPDALAALNAADPAPPGTGPWTSGGGILSRAFVPVDPQWDAATWDPDDSHGTIGRTDHSVPWDSFDDFIAAVRASDFRGDGEAAAPVGVIFVPTLSEDERRLGAGWRLAATGVAGCHDHKGVYYDREKWEPVPGPCGIPRPSGGVFVRWLRPVSG